MLARIQSRKFPDRHGPAPCPMPSKKSRCSMFCATRPCSPESIVVSGFVAAELRRGHAMRQAGNITVPPCEKLCGRRAAVTRHRARFDPNDSEFYSTIVPSIDIDRFDRVTRHQPLYFKLLSQTLSRRDFYPRSPDSSPLHLCRVSASRRFVTLR